MPHYVFVFITSSTLTPQQNVLSCFYLFHSGQQKINATLKKEEERWLIPGQQKINASLKICYYSFYSDPTAKCYAVFFTPSTLALQRNINATFFVICLTLTPQQNVNTTIPVCSTLTSQQTVTAAFYLAGSNQPADQTAEASELWGRGGGQPEPHWIHPHFRQWADRKRPLCQGHY